MTKIIKVMLLAVLFALIACTHNQAREAWLGSATGMHLEDMIKSINDSNVRRTALNYPIIKYKILYGKDNQRIFVQSFNLNRCLIYWNVDEYNILRTYRLEGDC